MIEITQAFDKLIFNKYRLEAQLQFNKKKLRESGLPSEREHLRRLINKIEKYLKDHKEQEAKIRKGFENVVNNNK